MRFLYYMLLSLSIFFTTACQKEQKQSLRANYDKNTTTLINVYGKTDKRLKLKFYVSYRSKYFPDGKVTDECTEVLLHPVTATKRGKLLHTNGATVKNQDEYNLTFPIFNKILHDKCTSTPIGISVRITRANEKHGLYSVVPILTDTPIGAIEGFSGGSSVGNRAFKTSYRAEALEKYGKVKEPPKYFRVKDGAKVGCYTVRYGAHKFYTKPTKERMSFRCALPYKENASWRDVIVDDKIHLDIIIDDNKTEFLQRVGQTKVIGRKDFFQEEKLNLYDKLKLWIKGE